MTADDQVEFMDTLPEQLPGPPMGRPSTYKSKFEQLRKNPGKWGRMASSKNTSTANATKSYLIKKFGEEEFEYEVKNSEVFARYIAPKRTRKKAARNEPRRQPDEACKRGHQGQR